VSGKHIIIMVRQVVNGESKVIDVTEWAKSHPDIDRLIEDIENILIPYVTGIEALRSDQV
jgi:hypothetical protein